MKYIKYLLFLLLIAFIAIAIYVAVQPNDYTVTRSKTIEAPASLIYDEVIDFKNWKDWNAWIEENPEMIITYPEQTKDIDGSYTWLNKGETGRMTTIAAKPNTSITQNMQFGDQPSAQVDWSFTPNEDGSTEVTWTISGHDLPFGFKAYSAYSGGMDKQIGPYYERSLELLDRKVVESMKQHSTKVDGITEYGGGFYLYKTTSASGKNISKIVARQHEEIINYMSKNTIIQAGMPFTIYNDMNPSTGNVIMTQAIPVMNNVINDNTSEILCGYMPKTTALKTTLTGNYTYLPKAWDTAYKAITELKLERSQDKPFEIYINDSKKVPNPSLWKTEIYIPITLTDTLTSKL